ncbi:MAG: PatB family C-S lyase [Prolixibacteraceae bacterium]|nr:PatB family C-S lyase [Prolixibacteraceae bacterium]
MEYNFDELIDRENTNCEKYDSRKEIFGKADVLPLWVADTDFKTPPFIVEAVKKRASHEVYGYPVIPDSFYKSIQSWMKKRHNWDVELKSIDYAPNVVVGLASAVLSMTELGDKIIVQPPVYFPFFHVVEGNSRIMAENQLIMKNGRYHFDFDDLEKKAGSDTKMLLLCNPHNPGGMVWTREELTKLGEFCLRKNIIVVSDEIHSDLVFSGHKHTPFASIKKEFAQNSITISSASKTFNMAGLSSAYVIIPNKELHQRYKRFMQATHISSGNFFGLVATEAAYMHGEEWLGQLLVYLEENYRLIESFFAEKIPAIKPVKPESTFLVWIDISGLGITGRDVFKRLVDSGLGLSPGWMFGKGGENFIRLNIGCPRSTIEKALQLFLKAFPEYVVK